MARKYLLDSNIFIHILRRRPEVRQQIERVGWENCCIAEPSIVELLYGAECSASPEKNLALVEDLISHVEIIHFNICIREFCKQKARLRRLGTPIEDYDLFIGSTAVTLGFTLVSENAKHLSRIEGIELENWVIR